MDTFKSFTSEIYEVNDQSFDSIALAVFRYQAKFNALYSDFLRQLKVDPNAVTALADIPYLPVSFFKTHTIQTSKWVPETVFTSSGTTGTSPSRHFVRNTGEYRTNAQACFEYFFGPVSECHFLALLPSYLERGGSSLIAMMDHFIRQSGSEHSGFYLDEHELLLSRLFELRGAKRKVILWGVSFALMDLAYSQQADLSHCIIFETGGMKGRRREITREEMHNVINERLQPSRICSEYGMTELFSQAYTTDGFAFKCPSSYPRKHL